MANFQEFFNSLKIGDYKIQNDILCKKSGEISHSDRGLYTGDTGPSDERDKMIEESPFDYNIHGMEFYLDKKFENKRDRDNFFTNVFNLFFKYNEVTDKDLNLCDIRVRSDVKLKIIHDNDKYKVRKKIEFYGGDESTRANYYRDTVHAIGIEDRYNDASSSDKEYEYDNLQHIYSSGLYCKVERFYTVRMSIVMSPRSKLYKILKPIII